MWKRSRNEVRESTPRHYHPVGREGIRGELQGNSNGSEPTKDFIYRHHVEPRVHLNVPKEESFAISLKYIDVTKTTNTNLDELQKSRIDDFSKDVVDPCFTEPRTRFTKFTLPSEKPSKGCVWFGERITKNQATTRPDYLWPTRKRLESTQPKDRSRSHCKGRVQFDKSLQLGAQVCFCASSNENSGRESRTEVSKVQRPGRTPR